jgi:hypothetical protein
MGRDYFGSCWLQAQPEADSEEAQAGHRPGVDTRELGQGSEPEPGLCSSWEHMVTLARLAGPAEGWAVGIGTKRWVGEGGSETRLL